MLNIYHLYKTDNDLYKLLMLSPFEWNYKIKNLDFVASVKMLADHTWEVIKESNY